MKWFNRTAQVFTPGSLRHKGLDVKGRPNGCRFGSERNGLTSVALFLLRPIFPETTADGQVELLGTLYPGLKTWAVLWGHFMAKGPYRK
jgi:hypothetical protein